jgi:hypothetical protein
MYGFADYSLCIPTFPDRFDNKVPTLAPLP